jgi:hypothetical protein
MSMAQRKPSSSSESSRPSGTTTRAALRRKLTENERPSEDPAVLRDAAEEQVRKQADELRRFPLPIAAEPAFTFRP